MGGISKSNVAKETGGNLADIRTAIQILDNIVSGSEAQVDIVAPLPAGTNAIGKLAANSGVDIGDVDVTSLPSLPAGTNNIGDVDVLTLPALPTGSNVIGQVTANAGTNLNTSLLALETTQVAMSDKLNNGTQTATVLNAKLTDYRNSSVSLTNTAADSLASSLTACAVSERITNLRNAVDIWIHCQFDMANTAPANDKAIYIWLLAWYYDGSTYTHADIGTSTAASTTSAAITLGQFHNLHLLGVMNYTTADQIIRKSFSFAKTFGPTLPDAFSIVTQNYTGAAIAASGSSIKYREIYQKTIA